MDKYKSVSGFTLIEIMIAVLIVGIVAAVAYPSFDEYLNRAKRIDGRDFMLDIASNQEAFYAQNLSYANSITGGTQLAYGSTSSPDGYYTVAMTVLPAGCSAGGTRCRTYSLTATPVFQDSKCATLTYNNSGTEGSSGTGTTDECWK